MVRKFEFILSLFVVLIMTISPALGVYEEACSCHKTGEPKIDESVYLQSRHVVTNSNSCTDCHVDYTSVLPHSKNTVDCDACHAVGFTEEDWDVSKHDVKISPPKPATEKPGEKASEKETPGFNVSIAIIGILATAFLIRKYR